jgi:tungstate transport system ATP-binding protein
VSISDVVLSAENLRVELGGAPVLDIPLLNLHNKEVLAVVGPNGSGKSTLLLTLACLLKPVSGHLVYRGECLDSGPAAFRFRRKIAMVFQEPLLFDSTVYDNVAAGLRFRGLAKSLLKNSVNKYLKMFNIEHLSGRSARKLSGGESQRTSLARAFAVEPEIILLDEPFSALDPPTRHDLVHDLDRVVKSTGTTTVMVTHVEFEALNLSGRIAVMNGGRIVQVGSPSAVMQNPTNEFVAKLVGMETILNGKVRSSSNGLLAISVFEREVHACGQAAPNEDVLCGIRPENVIVSTDAIDSFNGRQNVYSGRVTHIYSMGPFVKLRLDCGFPLVSLVTREGFSEMKLEEGKEVYTSFKPDSVHLIPADRNEQSPI